jgi:hypothetical protein
VAASTNPWSQVYKLAAGKTRVNNIITSLKKPDGTETSSIREIMEIMMDYVFTGRWRRGYLAPGKQERELRSQ